MNNAPYFFNQINIAQSLQVPGTLHTRNTHLVRYFQKYLLQSAISVFDITIPKKWPKNYFLYSLFCLGCVGVFNTDKYGIICQHGTLCGEYDIYYQPSKFMFHNPKLKNDYFLIRYNGEIIFFQPDYSGMGDIITYYADLLGVCIESGANNIANSKLAYILLAKNKACAETLKKLIDEIMSGNIAVAANQTAFDSTGDTLIHEFSQNLRNNFIAPDQFNLYNTILNMFYSEIGIPNANTVKKERLISDEVNANNFAVRSKAELWLDNISLCMENVREMFNLSENELNIKWREGVKDV